LPQATARQCVGSGTLVFGEPSFDHNDGAEGKGDSLILAGDLCEPGCRCRWPGGLMAAGVWMFGTGSWGGSLWGHAGV
jgi:hypothetical protein